MQVVGLPYNIQDSHMVGLCVIEHFRIVQDSHMVSLPKKVLVCSPFRVTSNGKFGGQNSFEEEIPPYETLVGVGQVGL